MARNESPIEETVAVPEGESTTETTTKSGRKPAGSNFSIDQLLGKLAPSVAAENDPLEQHRKQIAEQVEAQIASFAQGLVGTLQGTTDEDAVKAALVSLDTVKLRALKAAKSTSPAAV